MDDVWGLLRFLHVLAMALFVGGQLVLVAAVVPVLRDDRDRMRAAARRFGYATLVAIGVLLATGTAIAFHLDRWDEGTLHVKLALVALVGVLLVWHLRRPTLHALQGAVFVASLLIVWLGLSLAHG